MTPASRAASTDQVAWLACQCSQRAVSELMRVSWRTVGRIVSRVAAEAKARCDPLEYLKRIGIDELSHRKGQRYLTVVVDHDSGLLVWAAVGFRNSICVREPVLTQRVRTRG